MAVLFAEGFTGVPRGSYNVMMASHPLSFLGWTLNSIYNGTTAVTAADTNHRTDVEADPIFAARNRASMVAIFPSTVVTSYLQQAKKAVDTSGFNKFVLGMILQETGTAASALAPTIAISGPTMWTNSSTSFPTTEIFAQMTFPGNGSNGTISTPIGSGQSLTTPLLVKGKQFHFEAFIEQDVDRVRIYLDGTLVLDYTYTGTFAASAGGFSVLLRTGAAEVNTINVKVSNVYLLGVDDIHTGILGPNARVLEVAPSADFSVQWDRPTSYASNAAVLQQYFNAATPDQIVTGDTLTDLYSPSNVIQANAATVYGVAMKVRALTMAEGTHTIAAAARYNSVDEVSPRSATLSLGTPATFVLDISKNPSTNARWTPSEITAAGIGIKMVS